MIGILRFPGQPAITIFTLSPFELFANCIVVDPANDRDGKFNPSAMPRNWVVLRAVRCDSGISFCVTYSGFVTALLQRCVLLNSFDLRSAEVSVAKRQRRSSLCHNTHFCSDMESPSGALGSMLIASVSGWLGTADSCVPSSNTPINTESDCCSSLRAVSWTGGALGALVSGASAG